MNEIIDPVKKEYPVRDGVYGWYSAFESEGMLSNDKSPLVIHDSGSLYVELKKLSAAGLCVRCRNKSDGDEICSTCRKALLPPRPQ